MLSFHDVDPLSPDRVLLLWMLLWTRVFWRGEVADL